MRLAFLDGARGCACALVMVHHCLLHGHGAELNNRAWFQILVANNDGAALVNLFWAISGFALACHQGDDARIVASALARLPRLYFTIMSAVAAFIVTTSPEVGAAATAKRAAWWPLIVWNQLFRSVTIHADPQLALHFIQLWTFEAEVKGSFMVYALCFVVPRVARPRLLVAMVTACASRVSTAIAFFGVGFAAQIAHDKLFGALEAAALGAAVAPTALAFHVAVNAVKAFSVVPPVGWDWMRMAQSFGLLAAMSCSARTRSVLESRPVQFLGRHSFALYVVHMAFIKQLVGTRAIAHPALFVVVVAGCSVTTALALTRVDRAVIAASKRFAEWMMRVDAQRPPEEEAPAETEELLVIK
jgi:peptidoglycan/LPS O-acetylase OafA/YrhL